MEELITEIREDFQIHPYYDDNSIHRLIIEGEAYFNRLNSNNDFQKDVVYRMLLKNYVYYAYHHKVSEYVENYASTILTWQMESEV